VPYISGAPLTARPGQRAPEPAGAGSATVVPQPRGPYSTTLRKIQRQSARGRPCFQPAQDKVSVARQACGKRRGGRGGGGIAQLSGWRVFAI
jgi:hypothetical protein